MTTNSNNMNSNQTTPPKVPQGKFKALLYGLGAFYIFMIFTVVLRLISGKYPDNPFIFKIFQKTDFGLGFIVAIILTYARYLRRR